MLAGTSTMDAEVGLSFERSELITHIVLRALWEGLALA